MSHLVAGHEAREGRAHAALVYDGAQCVGWCQFGPTEELPRIKHRKAYNATLHQLPEWRITCFFVGRTHRHRGVANAALAGALDQIARLGGGLVESYPEETGGRTFRARSSTTQPLRSSSGTGSSVIGRSASTTGW
jgi:hypothetical protein